MDEIQIIFIKMIQDHQEFGTENDFLNARIFFVADGKQFVSHIRQPAGGGKHSFEELPIEVETPEKLIKKLNYGEFRDALEKYYRMSIGENGRGIRIDSTSSNISMIGNVFEPPPFSVYISRTSFETAW